MPKVMGWWLYALAAVTATAQTPAAPRAIVVDGAGPWQDANWNRGVNEFSSLLADAGYQVKTVSPANLASAGPTPDMLLAVPSLESLPLTAFKTIAAFVAAGGSLMASGGQPFRDPLYPAANGQWLDGAAILQTLAPVNTALDPATATLTPVASVAATVTKTTVTGPDGQSKALDFQLSLPQNNYYLYTGSLSKPAFPAGQTATIVSIRGTPGHSMLFEWIETDGSRWLATVPLTTAWTKQVLLPADFVYQAVAAPARAGTTFNPAQASSFYFGVSAGLVDAGPVEFALTAIGTAAAPTLETFPVPVLETLSPYYKQYVTQMAGQTVRVPVARGRGLSATPDPDGRFRAIGDPQAPVATWYITTAQTLTIWLPWPHLQDPQRAELVALLAAAPNRLYILNAGPTQIVTLPTEDVVLGAGVINASPASASATLNWSILDSTSTAVAQATSSLSLTAGQVQTVPTADVGQLPSGDYTVIASLVLGTQEVDRLTSRVRVFDPTLNFQPGQQITTTNGSFATAAGGALFLQGVNYQPRYAVALEPPRSNQNFLTPQNYDPDLVEADLALLASQNFNLVSFQYTGPEQARALVDFLDRCRNHGIWANIYIPVYTFVTPLAALFYGKPKGIDPNIGALLQAAFLPGNDRVFAYDMLFEPVLGLHSDRLPLDSAWRSWIVDQYGSLANAENLWGFAAPRDASGQISNPLDNQIENDGAWRVMVAAYRRFIDDFESRSFGVAARLVRAAAPGTLLSFRQAGGAVLDTNYALLGNGTVMLNEMAYEIGAAAAHLDFTSPQGYSIPTPWPAGRGLEFATAYARYRSGGKPIYWAEYGFDIGANGGTAANIATQVAMCDSMMRLVNEDGAGAASVWWMPGGWRVDTGDDYGIFNPDGSPRPSALVLAQWAATFAATPPAQTPGTPTTLTIDRDADARGDIGLFLRWQKNFAQARAGGPVVLTDAGRGTDTASMPQMQVGNIAYAGSGPLQYANGEFAGVRVQCAGLDVTVENGAQVPVPAGSACQVTATLVNTGSATWLPTAQSTGGVVLHTSAGDAAVGGTVGYLQRTGLGPLAVTVGTGNLSVTGRMQIQGGGAFGEVLRVSLVGQ